MDNSIHPAGYSLEMRQAFLAAAFAVAIVAIPLTVALFATPVFADNYFSFAATAI